MKEKAWQEIATEVETLGKQSKFQFSPNRRHLDLDDSAPSLNVVSRNKKSAWVRQADGPTNFNPINLQFYDKKSASVSQP